MHMLWLVLLGLPLLAGGAMYARYFWYPRWRHKRCLAHIARMDVEDAALDREINRLLGKLPEAVATNYVQTWRHPYQAAIAHKQAIEDMVFFSGARWPVESTSSGRSPAVSASAVATIPVPPKRREPVQVKQPSLDVPLYLTTGVPIVH